MLFHKKYLIGQELVNRGMITQDDLDYALIEHERTGMRLGQALVKCGFITTSELIKILAEQLGIEVFKVSEVEIAKEVIDQVSANLVRRLKVIPVLDENNILTICMSEPLDNKEIGEVKAFVGKNIKIVLDSDANILSAIKKYYGVYLEDAEGER